MKSLTELRSQIDVVDDELVRLFVKRMDLVDQVAAVKRADGKAVLDGNREQEVLARAAKVAGELRSKSAQEFMKKAMDIAKAKETEII